MRRLVIGLALIGMLQQTNQAQACNGGCSNDGFNILFLGVVVTDFSFAVYDVHKAMSNRRPTTVAAGFELFLTGSFTLAGVIILQQESTSDDLTVQIAIPTVASAALAIHAIYSFARGTESSTVRRTTPPPAPKKVHGPMPLADGMGWQVAWRY